MEAILIVVLIVVAYAIGQWNGRMIGERDVYREWRAWIVALREMTDE